MVISTEDTNHNVRDPSHTQLYPMAHFIMMTQKDDGVAQRWKGVQGNRFHSVVTGCKTAMLQADQIKW